VAQGGWEYNVVLIAALTALIDAGPGDVSVDARFGREEWGPGWAVGGLAVGLAASAAAVAMGRRGSSGVTRSPADPVAQATTDDTGGDPVTAVD
jgi:putative oxidoreductase